MDANVLMSILKSQPKNRNTMASFPGIKEKKTQMKTDNKEKNFEQLQTSNFGVNIAKFLSDNLKGSSCR